MDDESGEFMERAASSRNTLQENWRALCQYYYLHVAHYQQSVSAIAIWDRPDAYPIFRCACLCVCLSACPESVLWQNS